MIFSTPGYDVREIFESYQEILWFTQIAFLITTIESDFLLSIYIFLDF